MGGAYIIYTIILALDLLVGTAVISWKCQFQYEVEECELAVGGTIGSVIMWLLLLFVIPSCLVGGYKAASSVRQIYDDNRYMSKKTVQYEAILANIRAAEVVTQHSHVTSIDTSHETSVQPDETDPASVQYMCETDTAPLINQETDS